MSRMNKVRSQRAREKRHFAGPLAVLGLLVTVILMVGGCSKGLDKRTHIPGSRAPSVTDSEEGSAKAQMHPGSLPSPAEEVWVISRTRSISANPEETPGTGSMLAGSEENPIAIPLRHTDVKAQISGYIATVKVTQQFHNPFEKKIEAVYVFPLPENAAVNEFIMTIGERRIRGIIRERKEAEQIYMEAKRQGHVASLLTQERPNIFTQSVANIEPGKAIDVTIQYFHTLANSDGWYEFVFPMVVGPRFNPPSTHDGVGAVPRGQHGTSGQRTEVSYLAPSERSGHDIALQAELNGGMSIEEMLCRSHSVTIERPAPERAIVRLNPNDSIPNKDFVLRYRLSGDALKAGLMTHRDERGGFFSLMLQPPQELTSLSRQPIEMVFVLDCSGSMDGRPLEQAKAAVKRTLELLNPEDSFQLIRFSSTASQLGRAPLEATPANIKRGLAYLSTLNSEGGTMMIEGIKAALDFPHDPRRLRFVTFLTDGFIGNDDEIIAETRRRLRAARLFSFGVGSSVNRYLMDGLAQAGRGAVTYLALNEDAAAVMEDFVKRISHPALTDVQADWNGLAVENTYPARIPDLFPGRPVVVTGRFSGTLPDKIILSGKAGDRSITVPIQLHVAEPKHPGLPSVWARTKISDLLRTPEDASLWEERVRKVALDFNLVSAFTAFLAVDSSSRTQGAPAETVPVPVPVPEGVNYHKTVGEN